MLDPADTLPADRTVPHMLRRGAERYGQRPLLRAGDEAWSFAEAPGIAARAAGRFAAAGVGPGDRVAMMCGNRAAILECILGCAWLGAIAVPINVASRGLQLRHILGNSAPRILVVEAAHVAALATVEADGLDVAHVWTVGDAAGALGAVAAAPMPPLGEAVPPASVRPGDTFAILYTSGTTGPSKGVCCPHAQYFWWGLITANLLGVRDGDVLTTPLPLFHSNALNAFFQALLSGSTLVVLPRFSVSTFWDTLIETRASVTYLLGAMVPMLLSRAVSEAERTHRVRSVLAPGVPGDLQRRFVARTGIAVADGYGSTETNYVIGGTAGSIDPGSMGPVVAGFHARVVDEDDNEMAPGAAGELMLRADEPFAFATGYWGMPERTVEAWRNLWFHTGDRVIRDADDTFRFVDRMKDAIRRRGENISSYEVEQVLLSHPDIATAAAYPARSELAEDEVMAAIVVRDGRPLEPEAIIRFCEGRMPYFAIPRYLVFDPALPATENGKVQKYKLIERGITPQTWDREKAGVVLRR
ncbi:MAG: ATP-dependent acyl-CoA ligase [Acidisphaera sp.]|nr:ATP-dependent acyl-CoA ligase [Acidisphaera sp.]MBV9812864.1 ATP-dependent acyl-CoA ligase [Acetobacteraceae bacterium]